MDYKGLRPDPELITPMVDYPAQMNVKQLRSFLEMVGYYARFLKRKMKAPLTRLLRKGQPYEWVREQQEAFEPLKDGEDGEHPIVYVSRMLTPAEQ